MKYQNLKKLMIKFICLVIFCSFTGCSRGINETNEVAGNRSSNDPPITVICQMLSLNDQSKRIAHAEDILKNQGFNFKFEIFRGEVERPDPEQFMEAYKKYCKEKLSTGKNVICIVPDSFVDELTKDGVIKEISKDYVQNAPNHYSRFFNTVDQVYGIPTDMIDTGARINKLAVLVKKDIAEAYGKKITNIADYENFLKWAHENYKAYVPGLFPVFVYNWAYSSGYTPFDFFAPEYGYSSVDWSFKNDGSAMIYTNAKDVTEQPVFSPAETLPEFKESLLKLYEWQLNGFIELRTPKNIPRENISRYASVVVNTEDYISTTIDRMLPDGQARVNAADYEMYVFYPKGSPNVRDQGATSNWKAVVGKNTDPTRFIAFISWLTESRENYDTFHYGILDTDYKINNGSIQALNTPISYSKWDQLRFFTSTELSRPFAGAAPNWEEETEQTEYISLPFLEKIKYNQEYMNETTTQLLQDAQYKAALEKRKAQYENLLISLYVERTRPPEALIDDFINDKSLIEAGKYIAETYKRILNYMN